MNRVVVAPTVLSVDRQELYTLNFGYLKDVGLIWMADFLELFPIFSLTSNFPLIAITLRKQPVRIPTLSQHAERSRQGTTSSVSPDGIRTIRSPIWYCDVLYCRLGD